MFYYGSFIALVLGLTHGNVSSGCENKLVRDNVSEENIGARPVREVIYYDITPAVVFALKNTVRPESHYVMCSMLGAYVATYRRVSRAH